MDFETQDLVKKHLNAKDFAKFKKLISRTKLYNVPDSLTGELRPYQKIGYSWLVQNIRYGFGSILADDMGLGKTIQVLTAILHYKEKDLLEDKTVLIIVPPTLISNWENEIKKFTPDLTYFIYHGSNRSYPLESYDIILTSYGVVRLDLDMFLDEKWFICVIVKPKILKIQIRNRQKPLKVLTPDQKLP